MIEMGYGALKDIVWGALIVTESRGVEELYKSVVTFASVLTDSRRLTVVWARKTSDATLVASSVEVGAEAG